MVLNHSFFKNFLFQKDNLKVIFIWIPKNAGTSTYRMLNNSIGMKSFLNLSDIQKFFTNSGNATFGHIGLKELLAKGIISNDYWTSAVKFCFARNPYDRFVSLYFYMHKHNRIPNEFTFLDFIREIINGIPPVGLYNFEGLSQCNTQNKWIEGLEVDHILYFERFKSEMNNFSKILNISVKYFHENQSINRKNTSINLKRETVRLINEYYEEDFLRFNYEIKLDNVHVK